MTKLHRVKCSAEAELKVYVTDVRMDADLIVFETDDMWAASEPGIWWYTDIKSEADCVVCFTQSPWEADLTIYKTVILPEAGWVNSVKTDLL